MRKTGNKAMVRREGAGILASAKEYSGERIAAVRFQIRDHILEIEKT
jgi:hypothetical protein